MSDLPDVTIELEVNRGDPDPWVAAPIDQFISADIQRGVNRWDGPTGRSDAGHMTTDLDNSGRDFDPTNLAGPYVVGGATRMKPMLGIRARASYDGGPAKGLFRGFLDSPDFNAVGSDGSIVRLPATDGSKVLNLFNGPAQSPQGAGEDTGARMARILDNAGWPAALRLLDTGNSTLQATTLAGNALTEVLLSVDSELGDVYFDGDGLFVFRRRHAMYLDSRSATSQATFGDRRPALPYASVTPNYDETQLRNRITIARRGGTEQVAEDIASQIEYGADGVTPIPRSWGRNDLLMETDAEALNYAQYVLYQSKDPEYRFSEMVIEPQAAPDDLFPQVLERELGDRITIEHHPAGGGDPIVRDVFIRGIRHELTTGYWRTTWALQSATKFAFLVLDDPILGRLDENALGY